MEHAPGSAAALCAAQESLLAALEAGADAAHLERAFQRCSAALDALATGAPPAELARARRLGALLGERARTAHATTLGELVKTRHLRRWLAARRPADATGDACDVRG